MGKLKPISKIKLPVLRRVMMGVVIFSPMVAMTYYKSEPVNQPRMRQVGDRIVTPGSQLYLDLNPNF